MGKQFNIKGINGLYLTYKPSITLTTSNYNTELITDYDFFPTNSAESNLFDFKNSRYQDSSKLIGSNSLQKSNSNYTYSEILIKDALISNQMYYNTFKFYFRFYGSTLNEYKLPGLNISQTKQILERLRVKLYVTIGSNKIPMELSNLEKYSNGWVSATGETTGGTISSGGYGIQLATGLNSEDCIDMAYTGMTLFTNYELAPDKYNFRVDVSFPDFNQIANNNKNYKITVKYFNIGVAGTGIYSTSEAIELMSNSYVYYEQADSPTYNPSV